MEPINQVHQLQATVPLYLTNYCDSNCAICNMKHSNTQLTRREGTYEEIEEQLKIIFNTEKIRSLLILTGEYKESPYRIANLKRVCWTINKAFEIGFERISINIGTLSESDIDTIYNECKNHDNIGLSIFQETYNKESYRATFGQDNPDVPKSNYSRRLLTPDLWLKRGFSIVNIGILLGIGPVKEDIRQLIDHATYLYKKYHCLVQISLPRVISHEGIINSVDDETFAEIVQQIKQELPWAEIILTTRESIENLTKLIPYIDVISPGTSDVLAYNKEGLIPNNPETSQFFISKQRERPSTILRQLQKSCNITFKYFV